MNGKKLVVMLLAGALMASTALAQDGQNKRSGERKRDGDGMRSGERKRDGEGMRSGERKRDGETKRDGEGMRGRTGPGGDRTAVAAAGTDQQLPEMFADRLAEELNLTPEQKAKVQQIFQTHRQAVQNWQKENGTKLQELHQTLRQAMKDGDKDTAKATHQEIQKIMESRKALQENLIKQLQEVLTPEQVEKVKLMLRAMMNRPVPQLMAALAALNLTEEQKAAVKEITQQAMEKARDAQPEERQAIMREAFEKISKDVLTAEQRERLERMKDRHDFLQAIMSLKLTDEQKKQIQTIREAAKEKLEQAQSPQERQTIMQGVLKEINDTVLTQEQRDQLKKHRDQSSQPRQGKHRQRQLPD